MTRIVRRVCNASVCATVALIVPGTSASARADALVTSTLSHSIERFTDEGEWINTLASTGARMPCGIAARPRIGELFVGTKSNVIQRYKRNGHPTDNWESFTMPLDVPASEYVIGLLFDSAGDLYVASYWNGPPNYIYKYAAADLDLVNPTPVQSIATGLVRGEQLAFDASGDICVSSFAGTDETVRCFDAALTHQTVDYNSEIAPAQPVGVYFDASNRLYVTSVFTGLLLAEPAAHSGPLTTIASGMAQEIELVTEHDGSLYIPSYVVSKPANSDYSSDVVYKVNPTTGAIRNFITSHVWGPYQVIFTAR
jgi:hypothetical protein